MLVSGADRVISAQVPLAKMFGYVTQLRSHSCAPRRLAPAEKVVPMAVDRPVGVPILVGLPFFLIGGLQRVR